MESSKKSVISKDELDKAFINNELVLYYQPQFNLVNSVLDGVEALVRWNHPQGLKQPGEFLPAMEACGLTSKLGEWVLDAACKQCKEWKDKGLKPVRMAINVYSDQFQERDFVKAVLNTLAKYQIDPTYLELEITENMVIYADDTVTHDNIRRLRARGIQIALDDFGTGFSSISHLKRIQVDRIKIDRSYIECVHINAEDAAIVKAIIALAAGLNLRSLAEGVESHHQLQMLLKYDCQEAQGYYFSEPLTAQETEEFLKQHQNNPFIFKHL